MKIVFRVTLCFLGLLAAFVAVVGVLAARELMPGGQIPAQGYKRDYVVEALSYTGIMCLLTLAIGLALRASFAEKNTPS